MTELEIKVFAFVGLVCLISWGFAWIVRRIT